MERPLILGIVLLLALGCEERRSAPRAAASSSSAASVASAGGDEDLLPAIEIKSPKPRYALAKLSDKQVEKLVARSGFTPTVVGKSPASDPASTIRVGAFRKAGGQQLDAVVLVRCPKQAAAAADVQPGEAYYRDGDCYLDAAVRLGIRNKSSESKKLLEALLTQDVTP